MRRPHARVGVRRRTYLSFALARGRDQPCAHHSCHRLSMEHLSREGTMAGVNRGQNLKESSRTDRRKRYQPSAIYGLVESLRRQGIDLATKSGPWRAVERALQRPGRNRLPIIPIVTNGLAQVMVDTMEHARDLAGLLNWCGVDDLDPVPDLVPPPSL